MSQKIKKHFWRSLPYFMIFSLVFSTSLAGLVFNLEFKIVKNGDSPLGLDISFFEAQADTASTTVTVKNAPPAFVGFPAEIPASSSTTPVNVGASAYWQATADDPEANRFYLIICGTDAATAHNGAAPTCNGGLGETYCVSGDMADDGTATCLDTVLADPGAESDVWYAFVCDNHASEAACSNSNQGNPANESSSPLYINHAPSFTAVITSDNNKDPGGTFTVTASTTDGDVLGGPDEIVLNICSTNSWATSTGCTAATWCIGTSTSPDVSCSFATTTPARDGNFSYFAFIKDWHHFNAPVNGRTANYTVNNVAPSVSNVVLNGAAPIRVSIKNATGYVASTTADLYDANSCMDLVDATSSIFISSSTVAVGGLNCAADDNYCYQLETTDCALVGGSCGGSSFTTASYLCTITITYHAQPTDNSTSNPFETDNWLAGVTAIDNNGLKGASTSVSGVELESSLALEVTELAIPYGSIRGGQTSSTTNATTTIVNFGNTPIDTEVHGYDMIKSDLLDLIKEENQEFSLANFIYGSGTYTLSSTTPQSVDTVTPKPTSSSDVSDQIFWGIGIPGGTSSGDYTGQNVFTVELDSSDW